MTTTIDTNGHIVADTNTQQTAQTIADAVKLFADAIPEGHHASLTLQPHDNGDLEWVDAVAAALGFEPETKPMSYGDWHRTARGKVGPISVAVFTGGAEPKLAKRDRLAAEVAAIDAQIAANGHEDTA